MSMLGTMVRVIREEGIWHGLLVLKSHATDRYLIWNAQRKGDAAPLDLSTNTVDENRRIWNQPRWWTNKGEQWTEDVRGYRGLDPEQWKATLIDQVMLSHLVKGSTILEIGPGAGRWTEHLAPLAGRLILTDISKTCLDLCRERFQQHAHIAYHLIERRLEFIPSESIDGIWSYDVFVHINPSDIEAYVAEFARILKPGGIGVIHHPGAYPTDVERRQGFRTMLSAELFAGLVTRHGMKLIEQNDWAAHKPGDVISVFTRV
jgi:SAM-dependent methyltransferase